MKGLFVVHILRNRIAVLLSLALLLSLVLPVAAFAAPGDELLSNVSMEADADADGVPDCFTREPFGEGATTYELIDDAHTGAVAQRITVAGLVEGGNRKLVVAKQDGCAAPVTPGYTYDFSVWYRSTSADASLEVYFRDADTGVWGPGTVYKLAASGAAAWTPAADTVTAPEGVDAMSFGLATFADGTIDTDDYSVSLADDTPPVENPPGQGQGPDVVDQVAIDGLTLPTALEFLPGGRVMIAEKAGVITTFDDLMGGNRRTVLDIRDEVSAFEDFGLTAIAYSHGYLWGNYTPNNPEFGDSCDFYGRVDAGNKDPDDVLGCPTTGRVSRWPVDLATGELGPEQVVMDGNDDFCFQFTTHGVDALEVLPDGDVLVSIGDGANFTLRDYGQYGGNPCGDPEGYGGAFRSQTDEDYDGKIIRLDGVTGAFERIEARGLRNPFRMSLAGDTVYVTDTGWGGHEELNRLTLGGVEENFGWPCYEGPARPGDYEPLPACQDYYGSAGRYDAPLYAYPHDGQVASISAVEELDGIAYIGDYSLGFIKAVDPANPDEPGTVMARGEEGPPLGVVDLRRTPSGGMVYLDIIAGAVGAVEGGAGPEEPVDPVPTAEVTLSQQEPYQPGQEITFQARSSFRHTVSYDWTVTLVTGCDEAGANCTRTPVDFTGEGNNEGAFLGPDAPAPAVVEVAVVVTDTMTGQTAADTEQIARAADPVEPELVVDRVSGADRIATAVEVSRRTFQPGVPVAYVARADQFPDALAAGPLAAATGGPILLTETATLAPATAAELTRLQPERVVVLGGPAAVSDEVVAVLDAGHPVVERLSGAGRYDTAAAIAARLDAGGTVFVATGEAFPDAMVGGVAAGAEDGAVLLTAADHLSPATAAALAARTPARIVLLGGTGAVSAAVEAELAAIAPTTRIAGANRFETAALLMAATFPDGTDGAWLATGEQFPDALAVAPAAIGQGAALVLTGRDELPAATAAELGRLRPATLTIAGGQAAVSTQAATAAEAAAR